MEIYVASRRVDWFDQQKNIFDVFFSNVQQCYVVFKKLVDNKCFFFENVASRHFYLFKCLINFEIN